MEGQLELRNSGNQVIESSSPTPTCGRRLWRPTSKTLLARVERKILDCLKSKFETTHVKLPKSNHTIWTVVLNKKSKKLPLVMVHGMGGGIGLWAQNLDSLAAKRPVYAFDLLGFGRSSRPKFRGDAADVESEYVESIEEWREELKLDKIILLGHSLGAYIVSSYALKYPERIQHLFLVDPWGFPQRPTAEEYREIPLRYRIIGKLASPFNPLAIMRIAGPWGPSLIRRFRGDLRDKFSELFTDDTILDYIYHCNAQNPSGEAAFKTLSVGLGWARNPMLSRIADVDKKLPMTFVYGAETWMDKTCGHQTKYLRNGSFVDIKVIGKAGHHVYADEAETFNRVMTRCLDDIDKHIDNNPDAGTDETEQSAAVHREQIPLTQM